MSRTLDQVLSSLDGTYNPQIQSIQQRQAAIPGQIQAEESGLQAKQTQAFDDIMVGARRRNLGFSGIPLGEQAKYAQTEYMPALTRLRESGRQQAMSLEDALNGVYERRNTMGNQIYQNEQQQDEQRRQFDLTYQAQQQAARAAQASAFNPTHTPQQQQTDPSTIKNLTGGKSLQDAAGALTQLLGTNNGSVIGSTIAAIRQSAARGNTYDQAKLQFINSRPEFKQFLNPIAQPSGSQGGATITFPGYQQANYGGIRIPGVS